MGMWLSKSSWDEEEPRDTAYEPVATTEPVRIRHRPTCYEPELEAPVEGEKNGAERIRQAPNSRPAKQN